MSKIHLKRWDIVYIKDKYIYSIDKNSEATLFDYVKKQNLFLKSEDIRPCLVIKVFSSNIVFMPFTTVPPKKGLTNDKRVMTKTKIKDKTNFLKTNVICTVNYKYVHSLSKQKLNPEDKKIVWNVIDNFFKD